MFLPVQQADRSQEPESLSELTDREVGATRRFVNKQYCRLSNEDGKICAWHGDIRAYVIHKARAHGLANKKTIQSRVKRGGGEGFFVAKYSPTFEEVFRLEAMIGRRFDFTLDSPRGIGIDSETAKRKLRDAIRGIKFRGLGR